MVDWTLILLLTSIIVAMFVLLFMCEELDGPVVSALRRPIAEVKQRWSVIGWVIKNLLSRAPYVLRKAC
jgi:hypothetical protein